MTGCTAANFDAEQELAAAAAAFSAVMTAVESRGVKIKIGGRDVKQLRKELAGLNLHAKVLFLAATSTDDQMLLLAARYRRVTGLVFDMLISVDSGDRM